MDFDLAQGSDEYVDFMCTLCNISEKKTDAEYFCTNCDWFYCEHCFELKHEYLNGHAWLKLTNMRQRDIEICPTCNRQNKKATQYCEEHDEVCCLNCVTTVHGSCKKVSEIKNLAKGVYTSVHFHSIVYELDERTRNLEKRHSDRKTVLEKVKHTQESAIDMIQRYKEDTHGTADSLEEETRYEMNEVYYEVERDLLSDIDNCEDALAKVRFYNFLIKNNMLTGPQMFIKLRQIRKGLMEYDKVIHAEDRNTENIPGFEEYIKSTVTRLKTLTLNPKPNKAESQTRKKSAKPTRKTGSTTSKTRRVETLKASYNPDKKRTKQDTRQKGKNQNAQTKSPSNTKDSQETSSSPYRRTRKTQSHKR